MSIQKIPRAFGYMCDSCGLKHLQENAESQYRHGRPPGWASLTFGNSPTSESDEAIVLDKLLCPLCRGRTYAALALVLRL